MSIIEVAKLAGCSHTTVSRVINQKPGVSEAAALKVQAAMRKLGYTPPARRRGPQPKSRKAIRTGNVALLMFGTEATPMVAPVAAAVMHSVEEALGNHGFTMALGQVKDGLRIPPAVANGNVDGLILHGNPPSGELADRLKRYPAVWVMSPRARTGYWGDRVCPDNEAIGRMAADYLIERGHERIAFLGVDVTHLGFHARSQAFTDAAQDAGVAVEVVTQENGQEYRPGDLVAERRVIHTMIERFASLPERPTGLFVPRGQATLMVYEALRAHGIEPGRGVTIVACDSDPTLAGLNPQIATVDVRPDRIGTQAVNQLMRHLEKPMPHAKATILVEPSLIVPG